ncbi:DUF4785 family protein [Tahibacter soli]|uniref:DUF4785 family protein n=1 Tax=Tahibacter soli TaxID=2983605 RepID=A0A9X3YMC4_9GAMM|nr:DUF4785 family protein [Tahibacter soli]MDC8015066.1 DUF4785 family protein [Tahibacter soli]
MPIAKLHIVAGILVALGASHASAGELRLSAAGANDQVPRKLAAAPAKAAAELDRKPAALSWALEADAKLDAVPVPFVRESREYWLDASEAELRAGVRLPTTANEALVRISPYGGNVSALDADGLVVRAANGRAYAGREATQSVADADALRTAGMDVPEGTVIAKLAPAVGSGEIELAAPAATGRYLVHVYEPASTQVFKLGAARDTIVAGESITIRANFAGAAPKKASGVLSAPDGHTQNVDFRFAEDGSLVASIVPDPAHAGGPALWEVHAFAQGADGNRRVMRDARTAFAVTAPTARFNGRVDASNGRAGVALKIGVETASASRYQASGVLYGRADDGEAKPAAYAQSAAWIEAGAGTIVLTFDADALAAGKLTGPYELRDLRLVNQADMSVIERREKALVIR